MNAGIEQADQAQATREPACRIDGQLFAKGQSWGRWQRGTCPQQAMQAMQVTPVTPAQVVERLGMPVAVRTLAIRTLTRVAA
ncbi:hypothetical protein [Janthinobacterium sp.]|uniref:hypothetical protein n=1 Tax=Janthinobacterium sp. TaxID=1871054 RepID=UPI002586E032|nr:hypothetical protein [Janthinobacterium sp.]MCX7294875.1 hypothetical protein [Janthinobacterium sp.]